MRHPHFWWPQAEVGHAKAELRNDRVQITNACAFFFWIHCSDSFKKSEKCVSTFLS